MKLDEWQEQVLKVKGNLCLCSGRQVGKSTVIAIKAGEEAVHNKNYTIMVVAHVERQALLLFEKILSHIYKYHKNMIKIEKANPTKHTIKLINGSIIHCLPTGDSGYGIRGFTINALYADEAHYIGEEVWAAITPMLATTGGSINLLSTPAGTEGYFYRAFTEKRLKFTTIHVNTEEVAEKRPEPQRTNLLEFCKNEKERMTKLQYQQEYLGLFVGGIQRFIPDYLIKEVCIIDPTEHYNTRGDKFMGVDIAHMGGDETVLISVDRIMRERIRQFDLELPEGQRITDTARLIIHKDKETDHHRIYLDDGGLGVGVFDILFEDYQTKRKVVGLNNAKRIIDKERGKIEDRKKKMLGDDMGVNLKVLMEQGKIKLFDDPRIIQSLRSMQCDYSEGKLKIYGNYSHIFEALKRAAYCMKDKSLKPFITSM